MMKGDTLTVDCYHCNGPALLTIMRYDDVKYDQPANIVVVLNFLTAALVRWLLLLCEAGPF
eukprot:scaffold8082_cov107-Skeletonema_dohrnii-CCMP3373.AAC.1